MGIDWSAVDELVGEVGNDALRIIKPYLPALARSGKDVFDGFVAHVLDADWPAVNVLMYKKMTKEERRKLDEQIYDDAYRVALHKFKRKELFKEVLMKVLLSLVVKLA